MLASDCDWRSIVERRLEKLERQNRVLKCWGLAALLALGTLVAMGAVQSSQTLTAQKLVITDVSGKPRAVLAGNATGAMLGFTKPQGVIGASLVVEGDDSTLTLGGPARTATSISIEARGSRAWLRAQAPNGDVAHFGLDVDGPRLSISNAVNESASLHVEENGPSLLLQAAGTRGAAARIGVLSGTPSLRLLGAGGGLAPSASLSILESGPALALSGDENTSAWLRASKNGTSLKLEDSEGYNATVGSSGLVTPRTGETHTTSAASVVLFDKQKNVIWKAP
jgi:hypothetical protein